MDGMRNEGHVAVHFLGVLGVLGCSVTIKGFKGCDRVLYRH